MTTITTYILRPVEQQDLPVFAGWIRVLGHQNDPGNGDLEGYLLLELLESVRLDYLQQFLVLEEDNPILHITTAMVPAGKAKAVVPVDGENPARVSGSFRRFYMLINPAYDQEEYWLYALKKALTFFAEQDGISATRIRLSEPADGQEKALRRLGFRPCPQKGWYETTLSPKYL